MTLYPATLEKRFAAAQQAFARRLTTLETRTAGIDPSGPLMALPGVIDPGYTTGDPQVLVNGSATLTGPYQHLASYTPAASDAVLLMPVQGTYVVLGKLV